MLVLKLVYGERFAIYDTDGKELGCAHVEKHHSCGPNSVRMILDFAPEIKIYREKVVRNSPELQASLTPRVNG